MPCMIGSNTMKIVKIKMLMKFAVDVLKYEI